MQKQARRQIPTPGGLPGANTQPEIFSAFAVVGSIESTMCAISTYLAVTERQQSNTVQQKMLQQ